MTKIITNKNIGENMQVVSFRLDEEDFGIDILKVMEINKIGEITKMPNAPEFVVGIINLRGVIVPLIELRNKLGLTKKGYDKNTRILIVEVNSSTVGFIVDSVKEVLTLPQNILEPPPEITGGSKSDFILAVGKLDSGLITLIDLEKVISSDEKIQLTKAS